MKFWVTVSEEGSDHMAANTRKKSFFTNCFRYLLLIASLSTLTFPQPTAEVLGVERGLSNSAVRSVIQDNQGFLWVATWGGLDRYDGYSFVNYTNTPGDPTTLSNNNLVHVTIDGEGRPWATNIDGTINILERKKGEFTILNDGEGKRLYATWNGFPARFDDDHMVFLSRKGVVLVRNRDLGSSVLPVGKEVELREIVAVFPGGRYLYLIDRNKRVKKIQFDFELSGISKVKQGIVILLSQNGELYEFGIVSGKLGKPKKIFDLKSPSDFYTHQLHTDSKGVTRITSNEGLVLLDGEGKVQRSLVPGGEVWKGAVYSFFEDHFGNLWAGTGAGLVKLPGRKKIFQNYPENGDLSPATGREMLLAMLDLSNSRMLVGTTGGLYLFDKETQKFRNLIGIFPGVENSTVYRLFKDRRGGIWAGTRKGLLKLQVNGEKITSRVIRFKVDSGNDEWINRILSIAEADNGDLWLGTVHGLLRYGPGTGDYKTYYFPCDFGFEGDSYILSLFNDGETLWAGTNSEGLLRINTSNMTYTRYSTRPDSRLKLLSDKIMAITKDNDGNIWAATLDGGVNIISSDQRMIRYLTTRNGLVNNTVYGLLVDNTGQVWASTTKGLVRIDPRTLKSRNYTKSDGVLSVDFNQNSYYRGPDGKFYFGGSRGITVFNPADVQRSGIIPKLALTDLKVLNEPAMGRLKNGELVLDYDENFFSFEMAAISFEDPAYNLYFWKLEGLTDEWVNAGNRRTVDVSNIPPGEYILKARASNGDDGRSGETILAKIVVVPPFWMTAWFWIIAGMLLSGVIVMITYTLSRRKLNHEIAELEKEKMIMLERTKTRDRIARDLHDDLASTVSGAGLYMQSATNILGRDDETAKKMIEKSASLLTEAEQAMRDIVWSVSPQYDTIENLALRIRLLARELCEAAGIKFDFEKSGESSGILGDEIRRNLYLSVKEAVLNAVKHSGADMITITVVSEPGIITIRITDNGKGFRMESQAEKLGGNGLANIRKRCEEIGATSLVESFEGKGTTVTINCGIEK